MRIIEEQARSQVRSFLDELKNGTTNYRTVASLGDQVAQEYRGTSRPGAAAECPRCPRVRSQRRSAANLLRAELVSQAARTVDCQQRPPLSPRRLQRNLSTRAEPQGSEQERRQQGTRLSQCARTDHPPRGVVRRPRQEADTAFTFGFDPDVLEPIARVAERLFDDDVPTVPKFGSEPVVDWSDRQIEEYQGRLCRNGIEPVEEVTKYLSPYLLPRFLGDPPREVAELLADGHVTVIRLPLDGGKAGTLDEGAKEKAVESVDKQLRALDEAAMVFLHHLSALRITIDGKCVELMRSVDPELPFPVLAARRGRVRVASAGPEATDATERSFHVWSRTVGGDDHSGEAKLIKDAVLQFAESMGRRYGRSRSPFRWRRRRKHGRVSMSYSCRRR